MNAEQLDPDKVIDSKDAGDDMQRRIRYQSCVGVLYLLNLLQPKTDILQILCESHEDVLLKKKNGKFCGVQVKTKKDGGDPYKTNDEEVMNSLVRFCKKDKEFPNKFDVFVFFTNNTFAQSAKNSNNLKYIIGLAHEYQKQTVISSSENHLNVVIKKILKNANPEPIKKGRSKKNNEENKELDRKTEGKLEFADIVSTLCKINITENMPTFDYIESLLCVNLQHNCTGLAYHEIQNIIENLIGAVSKASALKKEMSLELVCAFCQDHSSMETEAILDGKRITLEMLNDIIAKARTEVNSLVSTTHIPLSKLPIGKSHRLKLKMAAGGISIDNINQMIDTKLSTEELIREWQHKYGYDEADKRYQALRLISKSESQAAYDETEKEDTLFGADMLKALRPKLKDRVKDVQNIGCMFEHLIGMSGITTEICEQWWSPRFEIEE